MTDRIRWMGGVSGKSVKKGVVSNELVKEGGVNRRMGGLSIPGQTESRTSRQEPGAMSRDGKPPADGERSNGPATRPFIDPVVRDRTTTQSDVSSPESGALVGPRPAHGPAVMAGSGSTLHPAR